MTHGFITINIKHNPEIQKKCYQEEKKEQSVFIEKDDESLLAINEEPELTSSK
jgi:hypothetical protein